MAIGEGIPLGEAEYLRLFLLSQTKRGEPLRQPYRCPVCSGRGLVVAGFYDGQVISIGTLLPQEPCRSCLGTGSIWS
jgi:hypothetical protein